MKLVEFVTKVYNEKKENELGEVVNDKRHFEPNILVGKATQSDDYIVFFMVKDVYENQTNLTIKQKTIPGKLKDKFIERFDYTVLKELSEEEIDLFLEENK